MKVKELKKALEAFGDGADVTLVVQDWSDTRGGWESVGSSLESIKVDERDGSIMLRGHGFET